MDQWNDPGIWNEGPNPIPESAQFREYRDVPIQAQVPEWQSVPERAEPQKKPKAGKLAAALQKLLTAAAVAAVVVLGVGDLIDPLPEIHFECSGYSEAILYFAELKGYAEGTDVTVEIYNDFVKYKQTVQGPSISGEFFDVKPDMTYHINVLYGGRVLYHGTVVTHDSHESYDPGEYDTDIIAAYPLKNSEFQYNYEEQTITYEAELSEYVQGADLTVEVFYGSETYTDTVQGPSISGTFTNVSRNVLFTCRVIYDGRVLHQGTVGSQDGEPELVTGDEGA